MAAALEWDVFISRASEDKTYTDNLYKALVARGVTVWYDKFVLKIGDTLRGKIDEGLASSGLGCSAEPQLLYSDEGRRSAKWPRSSRAKVATEIAALMLK